MREAVEADVDARTADEDVLDAVEEHMIRQVADPARGGLQLTGEDGLLTRQAKTVIESALDGEPVRTTGQFTGAAQRWKGCTS